MIFPKTVLSDALPKPKEKFFTVEAIKAKRVSKKYGVEYLIKWKGYDNPEDITWESAEDCKCAQMIAQFEKDLKKAQLARRKNAKLCSRSITDSQSLIPAVTKPSPIKQENLESDLTEEVSTNVIQKVADMIQKSTENVSLDSRPNQPNPTDRRRSIKFLGDASPCQAVTENLYQVENGKQISAILHVTKGSTQTSLRAMVKYVDNQFEFVPTSVLCTYAPKALVQFYEKKYTST
uniref:Chromo domain-containing protein n=1 Tax=Ditylenchus dipsaci TaxID=166011 RepID=A0A915DU30_9BILA